MRLRLAALPLLAAFPMLLPATGFGRPLVADFTPDPCPPGYGLTADTGLDGGPGCRELDVESYGAVAPRSAASGARAGESGEDRLLAVQQVAKMWRTAEAGRAGKRGDFSTADGSKVPASGGEWVNLGPKPLNFDDPDYPQSQLGLGKVSGRVAAIAIDRTDPSGDTLYIGTAGGGVWKSTNAGESFTPVGDTLPTQSIGGIAVDSATGWVYVGTGESNTGTDNYAGLGMFRSKDGGKTWQRAPEVPADTVISHVEVANPYVYVATSKGLYRSANQGDTFALAPLPTGGSEPGTDFLQNYVTDVRVQPGATDVVTAAVGWRSGGVEGAGLYRSTDAGATFSKLAATGFGAASPSADPIGRITLAYPTNPEQNTDMLWAVVQDPGKMNNENNPLEQKAPPESPVQKAPFTTLNGVYRSLDNGATWTLMGSYENLVAAPGSSYVPTFTPSQAGPGVQSWYNQFIAIDPVDENRVLLGLEEVFQNVTTPASAAPAWSVVGRYFNTCAPVNLGCPIYTGTTTHPDQHAIDMVELPDGTTRAYVGNDGGVVRQDAGADGFANDQWEHLNETLSTTQFHAAVMSNDGTVYGGMQDNGTGKILPSGYAVQVYGGDGFDVAVDPQDSNVVYAETQNGGIRKSADGGVNWTTITPTGNARPQFFTPFEMDPRDPNHIVYGTGQIWETTDGPAVASGTWAKVFEFEAPHSANAVDVEGDAVYVAFCGECNATPAAGKGGDYDPAIFTGGIATNVQKGCKRESGSTECWHIAAGNGLPKRYIGGISIDPKDPNTLYAAVSSYRRRWLYNTEALETGIVYVSHDAGENWTDLTGNLPKTFGADVIVEGDRLIVATDLGVFANGKKDSTEWVPFGTKLPGGVPAYDLSLNPKADKVVLATHGRGIWVLDLKAAGAGPKPVTVTPPSPPARPRAEPRPLPATGSPAWLLLAPFVLGSAVLVRRRLRRG